MPLTSLMDVFTILVFFLLVNSGSVEVMEAPKDSQASGVPGGGQSHVKRSVIFVSPDEILVQGVKQARRRFLTGERLTLSNVGSRLASWEN